MDNYPGLAPTLQRGSTSRRSSVAVVCIKAGPLERPNGIPTLERGNENPIEILLTEH